MLALQGPTVGEAERSTGRNNNFLLIRLIAASAVIYGHSFVCAPAAGYQEIFLKYTHWLWSGRMALDAFFVISGFLVTASLMHRGVLDYLAARVLRIFPGLLVCLLLTTLVLGPLVSTVPLRQYLADQQTKDYLYFNGLLIKIQYMLPGIFPNNPDHALNGPLWSLMLEGRLYLVLAMTGLLGLSLSRRLFNLFWACAIIVGVFEPHYLSFLGNSVNDLPCSLMFTLGSLIYVNRDQVPLHGGIVVLLAFLAVIAYPSDRFPIAFGGLLMYGVIWLAYVPRLTWFQGWGDYSYGVYIYGWPMQQLMRHLFPAANPLVNTVLALPAALAVACLSWHFVEKPALSLKRFVPQITLATLLARLRTTPEIVVVQDSEQPAISRFPTEAPAIGRAVTSANKDQDRAAA